MNFTKMQGTGNDFVVIEAAALRRDWKKLAISMCDRHFGIGGDGLILVLPSQKADFRMRIFNADGSEAEMCGNGIRCMAVYVYDRGLISAERREVQIETMAGVKKIKLIKSRRGIARLKVGMGIPGFEAAKIPASLPGNAKGKLDIKLSSYTVSIKGREILLHSVSMGNPHAVYFTEQPVDNFPMAELGPDVEHNTIFPRRTNFEVARVIDRENIEVVIWERGSGETLACGTGACAVAVISRLLGYTDDMVNVKLPGGTLGVEWNGSGEVVLSGSAESIFTGEWTE